MRTLNTPELIICKNEKEIAELVAKEFTRTMKNKSKSVLGLATGSSPLSTYKELIKLYKTKKISFKNVKTFNLDEYLDLHPNYANQSYYIFMRDNLFSKIDINMDNVHFPPVNVTPLKPASIYDKQIKNAGGIDLQLLGLGVNGHIAFNEPGTSFSSLTHVTRIADETIKSNARFFNGTQALVPRKAVTMGIKTILASRKIVLIAMGKEKARALAEIFKYKLNKKFPCTSLLLHPNVVIYADQEAASYIKVSESKK